MYLSLFKYLVFIYKNYINRALLPVVPVSTHVTCQAQEPPTQLTSWLAKVLNSQSEVAARPQVRGPGWTGYCNSVTYCTVSAVY